MIDLVVQAEPRIAMPLFKICQPTVTGRVGSGDAGIPMNFLHYGIKTYHLLCPTYPSPLSIQHFAWLHPFSPLVRVSQKTQAAAEAINYYCGQSNPVKGGAESCCVCLVSKNALQHAHKCAPIAHSLLKGHTHERRYGEWQ